MKLRPYQQAAVDAIFKAWETCTSTLVVLPTGCGKTIVFASVIKRLLSSPATFNFVSSRLGNEHSSDQQTNRPTDHLSPTESPSVCAGQPSVSEYPPRVSEPEGASGRGAQVEKFRPCSAGRLIGCSDDSSEERQNDSKEDRALKASGHPNHQTPITTPRVMVLAHREELITQARDKIMTVTNADVQIEMADFHVTEYFGKKADVVVSTVQTQIAPLRPTHQSPTTNHQLLTTNHQSPTTNHQLLTTNHQSPNRRFTNFDPSEFAALVIDEAHHATARSYRECVDYYTQNPNCRVLGVTATPDRADESALGQVFETVAYEYTVNDAIKDGWLVPIRQQLVKVESLDFSGVSTSAGDLNQAELSEVMEDEKNLHGIVSPVLEICRGRKTILFAASVKQAERICEIINRPNQSPTTNNQSPIVADWICGATPKEERRRKLEKFKRGETDVMCNVGILTEGFDDSEVEVIVMARPTKSRALYAQMAGRATRPSAEIADKLGLVEDSLDSSAESHFVGEGLPSELSSDQQTNRPTGHLSPTESPSVCAGQPTVSEAQKSTHHPWSVGRLFGCSDGSSRKRPNDSKEDCALDASESVSSRAAKLRREMIAKSTKPSCLIVDFVGNSGRHKLITTTDILGGKEDDDEEVRVRAKKIIEERGEEDTAEAIAEARKEIEERKAAEAKRRAFIQAKAQFVTIEVDPLNIYDLPPVEERPSDRGRRLSLRQEAILRERLKVDPVKVGYAKGKQLIEEMFRRMNAGLATLPQQKQLRRLGFPAPMRFAEASRALTRAFRK